MNSKKKNVSIMRIARSWRLMRLSSLSSISIRTSMHADGQIG
jgi:hypothetical protein